MSDLTQPGATSKKLPSVATLKHVKRGYGWIIVPVVLALLSVGGLFVSSGTTLAQTTSITPVPGHSTPLPGSSKKGTKTPRVTPGQDGAVDPSFRSGSGPNGSVGGIVIQNDGRPVIAGSFTTYNDRVVNRLARLNSDGSLDTTFNSGGSGANSEIVTLVRQNTGKLLIGGFFTTYNGITVNHLAQLNSDGSLDTTFNSGGSGIGNSSFDHINIIIIQSDGRILIGGAFSSYNNTPVNGLLRLNPDGTLDPSFHFNGTGGNLQVSYNVTALVLQSDGKIVIGGNFSKPDFTRINCIARLNTDGSVDTTFNPGGNGTTNVVQTLSIQTDGRILMSLDVDSDSDAPVPLPPTYNGVSVNGIGRLTTTGSLDTSFNSPTFLHAVAITPLSSSKILVAGDFGNAVIKQLNADGSLDTSFNPGGSIAVFGGSEEGAAIALQTNGEIFAGGFFAAYNNFASNNIVLLKNNGVPDTSFNPGSTGANDKVTAILTQGNDKVLIGGYFGVYNGSPAHGITRLNTDGSIDGSFNYSDYSSVTALALQSDGKILSAGDHIFTNTAYSLIRLNPDGTLDTTFSPGTVYSLIGIKVIAIQNDGKILLGGGFNSYNNVNAGNIIRVNPDGTRDTSFNPGKVGADNVISAIMVQSDGKIVLGGSFTTYNGVAANHFARLNSDGSLDTTFNVGGSGPSGTNITSLAQQGDGKILIGGNFATYNGTVANSIARINPDGTLDNSFNADSGASSSSINVIVVQQNGKLLVGGDFTSFNGVALNRVARLNQDGSLDTSFNPGGGANAVVYAIALQSDGKALIGGVFNSVDTYTRDRIARLYNTVVAGPPTRVLVVSGGSQQATINTAFPQPLVARVTDALNNPVGSVVVTFTAPVSAASGTFAGGAAIYTGTTSASGLVTSTGLTANGLTGVYSVTATVAGVSNPATFNLINMAVCDAFVVTSTQDDGSCGTLRSALQAAANSQTSKTKTITLPFPAGTTINLAFGLKLASRIELVSSASCGVGPNNSLLPPIILQGGSGDGLTLSYNNRLSGLWVRGFSGVQIKAPVGSHTIMQCVKASKN